MAKTKAVPVPVANAMDLIWNDGVVPAWLLGMTLGFVLLFPILKALFPKTCRKRGAFLLAFERAEAAETADERDAWLPFVIVGAWPYANFFKFSSPS